MLHIATRTENGISKRIASIIYWCQLVVDSHIQFIAILQS